MVTYLAQLTQADYEALLNPFVVKAHTLTNVAGDAGVKIAAAIALLPVGIGGEVDATGFANPQNLTGFTIPPGVTVRLGPVFFTMPTASQSIIVQQGARLLGAGSNSPGSTQIKAFTNFNKPIIKCVSSGGGANWWHHGLVKDILLDGNKANQASGNAMEVWGLGETSLIQHMSIGNAKQAGLYITGSQSGTGSIENVTVNGSGLYGIQCDNFRSGITLKCVGGDSNPVTLAITSPSQGGGSVLVIDLKSEAVAGGPPDPTILIAGGSTKITLTLLGGNTVTPDTGKTLIRIQGDVGGNPNIQIIGLSTAGQTIIIDDLHMNTRVLGEQVTYHGIFAYANGNVTLDSNNFTVV